MNIVFFCSWIAHAFSFSISSLYLDRIPIFQVGVLSYLSTRASGPTPLVIIVQRRYVWCIDTVERLVQIVLFLTVCRGELRFASLSRLAPVLPPTGRFTCGRRGMTFIWYQAQSFTSSATSTPATSALSIILKIFLLPIPTTFYLLPTWLMLSPA